MNERGISERLSVQAAPPPEHLPRFLVLSTYEADLGRWPGLWHPAYLRATAME